MDGNGTLPVDLKFFPVPRFLFPPLTLLLCSAAISISSAASSLSIFCHTSISLVFHLLRFHSLIRYCFAHTGYNNHLFRRPCHFTNNRALFFHQRRSEYFEPCPPLPLTIVPSAAITIHESSNGIRKTLQDFEEEESQGSLLVAKTELDIYLEETKLVNHKDLDILEYWKDRSIRFVDLGRMTSDILSIPITTVASEFAFSIDGWILNKYRSSMVSKNLQALICTCN